MTIDWFTFVAQIINFAVLIWLLNRFLYGPITRAMQQRETNIADRLNQAEDEKQAALQQKNDYRQLSQKIETDRHELFEASRQEADKTRQTLIDQARADVSSRRDEWLKSLQREQNSLISLVSQRASSQVLSITRQALSQLADADLEAQIVTTFLKRLKCLEPGEIELIQQESQAGKRAAVETAFELLPESREQISVALRQLGLPEFDFRNEPELVCGIELHVGGHKIAWSVHEFLMSLSEEIGSLMTQEQ